MFFANNLLKKRKNCAFKLLFIKIKPNLAAK